MPEGDFSLVDINSWGILYAVDYTWEVLYFFSYPCYAVQLKSQLSHSSKEQNLLVICILSRL